MGLRCTRQAAQRDPIRFRRTPFFPRLTELLRSEIRPLAFILTDTRIGAAQSSSPALHSRSNTARFSLSNT